MKKDSDFYKELLEVYAISKRITEKGDQSEEVAIAKFWDCNPYVSVTRGHFMFATKKITPGAHWIGIVKIATQKTNADLMETVNAYTKTSLAIADAFIIIDEAQNLTMNEVKTIITRIGEGTKIVLTGDIEQIDNSYVNETSNGLAHAVEKFKEFPLAAHMTFRKGERSELATLASKVL